jgi:hypothetical protein
MGIVTNLMGIVTNLMGIVPVARGLLLNLPPFQLHSHLAG